MIKMFEEYNSDIYKEISSREFFDNNEFIKFTDDESEKVKNLFSGFRKPSLIFNRSYSCGLSDDSFYIYICNGMDILNQIEIWKLSDEWYIVDDGYSSYYKCDQMDGLLECLKDIEELSK